MPCGCGAAKLARPVAAQAPASPIRNSLKPVRSSWTRLKASPGADDNAQTISTVVRTLHP